MICWYIFMVWYILAEYWYGVVPCMGSPGAMLDITTRWYLAYTLLQVQLLTFCETIAWYILALIWYIIGTSQSLVVVVVWVSPGISQSNAHLGDSPLASASHCIMRTNLYAALHHSFIWSAPILTLQCTIALYKLHQSLHCAAPGLYINSTNLNTTIHHSFI